MPPQVPATSSEIAALKTDIQELKAAVDKLKPQAWWLSLIPFAVAFIPAAVGVYTVVKNIRMQRRTLAEKAREEERAAIRTKINEFYGPFLQLRGASEYLYFEAFMPRRSPAEVDKYKGQSGHYRTILALADGYKFTGADATVLQLIVELGKKSADLIYTKIGLVDEPELQRLLAQATTHYKLMEIAEADGARLTGIARVIDKFTFPHELDEKVREKLAALNARLEELQEIRQ